MFGNQVSNNPLYVIKFFFILFIVFSLFISAEATQSTSWIKNPNHQSVKVKLTVTGQYDKQHRTLPAVLEVQLDGDWKTYWRSPGEGGIAPSIDWSQSKNIENVEWFWPTPERFSLLGLQTFGYKHKVAFPILFTLAPEVNHADGRINISGKFTLSSCTNICVLTDYDIQLSIDVNTLKIDSDTMLAYNKAWSLVPRKVSEDSVDSRNAKLAWDKQKKQLLVEISHRQWQSPQVIIDGDADTIFTQVILDQQTNEKGVNTLVAVFNGDSWLGEPELLGKTLNVTITDENNLLEYNLRVGETTISAQATSLWRIVVIALLGGLILNIMPCVLPVLGMKLSSIVAAPKIKRSAIRQQFIASALGILVSFWLLAGFIFLLKATGQAVGWGIQFQNPWFIGFMALITAIFSLNMLGVFEINLSSTLQTKLATTGGNNNKGYFLQGMFATLLATPCSAPFLGTAVAFALGADTLILFVVFSALAVGMALPWLMVALFPQLARYFPKPGRWMSIVKVIFSLMLLMTSLWLVSLLNNFIDGSYLWMLLLVLVLVYFTFLGKIQGKAIVVACLSSLLVISAITAFLTINQWSRPLPADLVWQPLNTAEITKQVAQGKTVFVDVTADWCITCKANKVGVILQDPVYSKLKSSDIVLMKGDWTKPSDEITQYLQSYNQFGVPFNIVYGPKAPEGVPLPVILSSEAVLLAIRASSEE